MGGLQKRVLGGCVALGRRARNLVVRFGREDRAASAVEFSIVAIPFLGIVMAILETTFVLFNAEMVDNTTASISRQLMTGQIQTSGQTCAQQKQTFQDAICPTSRARDPTTDKNALPTNFDCSKVIIDVRASNAVNNLDESNTLYQNPTSAQFNPASAGQNNIIRVIYPMTAILPIVSGFSTGSVSNNRAGQVKYNGVWSHILMGIAVFRTEPYGAGGGGSC